MLFTYDKFYNWTKNVQSIYKSKKKTALLHLRLILPATKKTLKMLYDPLRQSENLTKYTRGLFKPQINDAIVMPSVQWMNTSDTWRTPVPTWSIQEHSIMDTENCSNRMRLLESLRVTASWTQNMVSNAYII